MEHDKINFKSHKINRRKNFLLKSVKTVRKSRFLRRNPNNYKKLNITPVHISVKINEDS